MKVESIDGTGLSGVAVISATNSWAVGSGSIYTPTQIVHRNGQFWKQVPAIGQYGADYGLNAVAATSATTAGASGKMLRWNG